MAKKRKSQKFNVEYVKQCASGQWPSLLNAICGIPLDVLDGQHHPCPKCDGTDRFRFIDSQEGACYCNQCFDKKNGDGIAAVMWYEGVKFMEAVRLIASQLGIEPEETAKEKPVADPAKHLSFLPWSDVNVSFWCADHLPIKPEALRKIGARCATYRSSYNVLAIPVWGPELRNAPAVGWLILSRKGAPVYSNGPKMPPEMKTKFLTSGSKKGLIVPEGAETAKELWKTEGPTDLAAFLSLDLPEGVSGVCNANGAQEKPPIWVAHFFEGKTARVIHDADEPGQMGAIRKDFLSKDIGWAPSIAVKASDCRNVQLPYAVAKTNGRDLRDFLAEGNGYSQLVELALNAKPIAGDEEILKPEVNLAPDDPTRLAKVNLNRYASEHGGTLRCWRNEFYKWDGKSYRRISRPDLAARISVNISEEFQRLNIEDQENSSEDEIPYARKVTRTLVNNVIDATASLCLIPESVELLTWIEGDIRKRRNLIAMQNGILDLDALMEGKEDCLRPHSPNWFSTICLPYSFDPDADCPLWKGFLRRNLDGDSALELVLQEWAGYLLMPDTGFQKFLVLEGEGANGKSVYMAAITAMLGLDNTSHIPLELFGDRFAKTQTLGKLVNIAADAGELDKLAEGYLKSFTSGDVMYFDRKGIDGVDCTPTARLMMACNNRPRFSDRSRGLWRRMILVPLRVEIGENERIPNMDKVWWWEESDELAGIFNWALKGLYRLKQNEKFTEPDVSSAALESFQDETNPSRLFLKDHVIASANGQVRSNDIYEGYRGWCSANGYRPLSNTPFFKELHRMFSCDKKRGTARDEANQTYRFWYYEGVIYNPDGVSRKEDTEL